MNALHDLHLNEAGVPGFKAAKDTSQEWLNHASNLNSIVSVFVDAVVIKLNRCWAVCPSPNFPP